MYNFTDSFLNTKEEKNIGDMRTQAVRRGDYRARVNGEVYYMNIFTGLVIDLRIMNANSTRARIVIELQGGKRLAFFAEIDKYIKKGSIIDAIGVCTKEATGFFEFVCKGGYKRVFTNEEMYQIQKGVSPEDAVATKVPWNLLSCVRESDKIKSA